MNKKIKDEGRSWLGDKLKNIKYEVKLEQEVKRVTREKNRTKVQDN